ncbi:hypothetical protein LRP30_21675 [Bradyrhizobium sp. C-145]|uniref:hypothetical protein n=1 Tax=Bradyrhizobium sp. C-145 TaxID=574727 RepID=UPI00201B81FD|nr:hypothetical protein [Bradyrhizobium sp. C-145]UQR67700.1 hypothetical protein LRP30_21675 [Bradyrhizobium sp. C-145]
MKKFEELHIDEQIALGLVVLEKLAESSCNTLPDLLKKEGRSALDIWRNLCGDAGLDLCHPWPGFPEGPGKLPPARGGDRPYGGDIQDVGERLKAILARVRAEEH